jgi:hypothetical protein
MACHSPPQGRAAAPAAEFVLNELMKVPAYAELSKEDREAIAVAVAHIGVRFYLEGYNGGRRLEGMAYRQWFKGCWVGSRWPGSLATEPQ